jgi:phosphopantothenoylcysteine decarboxylase/phosphopantothenate--cysteine ligase
MTTAFGKIVLGVTGGIASYKAADLCSKLVQAGAEVRVAFSTHAHEFVTPLVFEALSGHPVYRQVFGAAQSYQMEHISWARWADALVIAPATADMIARMAAGRADDAITTLHLAFAGTVFVAPSMNTVMLEHPATQANLKTLQERGVEVIAPGAGALACGEVGSGRMAEPADIMRALGYQVPEFNAAISIGAPRGSSVNDAGAELSRAADDSLTGKTVLITSGPTREYLDPVRFISSPSSGRMGLALANEALRRGARVHFITGPVDENLLPQSGGDRCEIHRVQSARDMFQAVEEHRADSDMLIFAAAVGDFRPAQHINRKIKRSGNSITLPLVENPDISQAAGFSKRPGQVLIGFAAETDDHSDNARAKIAAKHLDAIVINDVANPEIGFNSAENEVTIVTAAGEETHVTKRSKTDVAFEIFEKAVALLG